MQKQKPEVIVTTVDKGGGEEGGGGRTADKLRAILTRRQRQRECPAPNCARQLLLRKAPNAVMDASNRRRGFHTRSSRRMRGAPPLPAPRFSILSSSRPVPSSPSAFPRAFPLSRSFYPRTSGAIVFAGTAAEGGTHTIAFSLQITPT